MCHQKNIPLWRYVMQNICWTKLLPAFGKGHAFSPSKVSSALLHPPLGRPPRIISGIDWNSGLSGHAETEVLQTYWGNGDIVREKPAVQHAGVPSASHRRNGTPKVELTNSARALQRSMGHLEEKSSASRDKVHWQLRHLESFNQTYPNLLL